MKRLVVAFLFLVSVPALAREYAERIVVDSPEDLYEMEQTGELDEATVELLVALLDHPVDVNRADRALLYDLPGVTYDLADAIVAYRAANGPFATLESLLLVPGVTELVFEEIAPFVIVTGLADAAADGPLVRGTARIASMAKYGTGREVTAVDPILEHQVGPQSYLRVQATGFTYFSAGLLATFRARTAAHFDALRGSLVTDGPTNAFDLDSVYLAWSYGAYNIIVGSYDVGFGERLTFDTSVHREPNGFYELNRVSEDNVSGKLRVDTGLFGVAAQVAGADLPFGWVDATAFASSQLYDVYQYGTFGYADPALGEVACDAEGDCPSGLSCAADGICRSSRVYDEQDDTGWRYVTLRDAYRESLAGANVSLNLEDTAHVGVTGYYSTIDFTIAEKANPEFALSSRFPTRDSFGAIGVDGAAEAGPVLLSAEYARTDSGGNGAYVRGIWDLPPWAETELSLRYYDGLFDNPHSRAEAEPDETLGVSQRNEEGVRLETAVKPFPGLSSVSTIDVWRAPWALAWRQGRVAVFKRNSAPANLHLRERVAYKLTSKETASITGQFDDRDVTHGGRGEVYESGDPFDVLANEDPEGSTRRIYGRGERRRVALSATTTRVPRLRVTASYSRSWEDKGQPEFDIENLFRLRLAVHGWSGGAIVASAAYWLHPREFEPDAVVSDREEPQFDGYLDVHQDIGFGLAVRARYTLLHYRDESPDRYAWYQLVKLAVDGKF